MLDACVVIDFCGRTDNLNNLMVHVGDDAVITSAVVDELERQRQKNFPRLAQFMALVDEGRVATIDPDPSDATAARIIKTWSSVFGAGEVSSAALAISRRWIFVSRDREPMRQLRLRETVMMESTQDILDALVRRKTLTKKHADEIMRDILAASNRRRRR